MNKIQRKILTEVSYYSNQPLLLPSFITFNLTFACNYQCRGCSSWKMPTDNQLTSEEWLTLVDQISQDFSQDTFIELSGGEPLVKKDLSVQIISRLKEHFKTVSLNSNGSLIDQDTAQKLADAGLDIIKLSFYSLNPETNNFLRGASQAYSHVNRAIAAILSTDIKLELAILITKQNSADIIPLLKKFSDQPNIVFNLQSLDENYQSADFYDLTKNSLPQELWPEAAAVKELFSWLYQNYNSKIKNNLPNLRLMEKYYLQPESSLVLRCFTGHKNLAIDPDGVVRICLKRPAIGNIRNQSLKEILFSAEARVERQAIKTCGKYCRIKGFNFSRGLKELFLG